MSQTLTPPAEITKYQPFVESTDLVGDPNALLRRIRRDGYLFIRCLLPREDVLDVRRRILRFCEEEGWLRPGSDLMEGLTDIAPIAEGEKPWEPVYEKIQRCEQFHKLKMHPNVRKIAESIFDERVVALPMTIARVAFPRDNARGTQPHQDWIYVQGSMDTLSYWAPLGDVPAEVGGLKLLQGSHKKGFLWPRKALGPGGHTVECDPKLQWVASDYRAGDVLIFLPLTIHAARENLTQDRLRLSIDFRYTGVSHAIVESWMKPHFHWLGDKFQWDSLDKDWTDQSLRRYWEREPALHVVPSDYRDYSK